VTPAFFRTPAQFRRWLATNHAAVRELWVGFYKVGSGRGGLTYKQALDEALCFGWIDGVRKTLDDEAFVQRFTPRTPKSYWSAVNIARAKELQEAGRMHAAGEAAFARRDTTPPARYSFEREQAAFDPPLEKQFRANPAAWMFFQAEAPWYRRVATHWVTSAKKPETRQRRLDTLIADCAAGRRIAQMPQKKS
jgi:uncharacterized protein YdeI (YjbR/CyaY-like superfamily)